VKKLEAEITIKYDNMESAEAIAKAVSPDNFKTPHGLSIKTKRNKNNISTYIKCRKELRTFIATIDDLLFSISIAEKTLQTAKKLK
jgi:tRNA threonylcarbamoyladenosine modification (KEOPS) complex  Pcc1 subunit